MKVRCVDDPSTLAVSKSVSPNEQPSSIHEEEEEDDDVSEFQVVFLVVVVLVVVVLVVIVLVGVVLVVQVSLAKRAAVIHP